MIEESHQKTMRMLSLFERLSQGDVIKKQEEAEHFHVSEKAIQRDIKDLRTYFSNYKYNSLSKSIIFIRKEKGYILRRSNNIGLTAEDVWGIARLLIENRALPEIQLKQVMLPAVLAAKKLGLKKLYMPFDERLPVLEFKDLEIVYITSLEEVILTLMGKGPSRCSLSESNREPFELY
ncbi:HTH domain-containing protein [Cytobacillus oceanisediminis]|uniref:HTH domain-containing protein n=1 Tax=Cytobacillus oceanisediminis TaxID=665099 RepID=A0A2V3A6E2_9BACI|nr:HTH domain-containing protein [Cytobacillus oceanisediminis]PWW31319.1 HTH domain-containing protein [Cytobacillus oceanisediminis]